MFVLHDIKLMSYYKTENCVVLQDRKLFIVLHDIKLMIVLHDIKLILSFKTETCNKIQFPSPHEVEAVPKISRCLIISNWTNFKRKIKFVRIIFVYELKLLSSTRFHRTNKTKN